MKDRANHTVINNPSNLRLDAYCVQHFECLATRNQSKKWIKAGYILLNDCPTEPQRYPKPGDIIKVNPPPAAKATLALPLKVHYLDPYLGVIEKPAGIHVSGNHKLTVYRALPHTIEQSTQPDALVQAKPAHRLDRRTSGLLLVARTAKALASLGNMFAEQRIHKEYRALVAGRIDGQQESSQPIHSASAATMWRPLHHARSLFSGWITELAVYPKTGRTHQIRIHLSQQGHAIVGDDLYHVTTPDSSKANKPYTDKGLFLAAVGLQFRHPITGQDLTFSVAPPEKFTTYRLRQHRRWEKYKGN